MTFEQGLELIQMMVIIVALVLIHRSYPAGKIDQLLDRLAGPVEQSPSKLDDILLEVAELLHGLRHSDTPLDVGGDTTVK